MHCVCSGRPVAAGGGAGGEQPGGAVQAGPHLHPVHGHPPTPPGPSPDGHARCPTFADGGRLRQQDLQTHPAGHTGESLDTLYMSHRTLCVFLDQVVNAWVGGWGRGRYGGGGGVVGLRLMVKESFTDCGTVKYCFFSPQGVGWQYK